MKSIFLASLTIFAFIPTMSFANSVTSVFKNDSNLPVYMQAEVLNQVLTQCSAGTFAFGLSEIATQVTPVASSDSYMSGLVYETQFSSNYLSDYHPKNQVIVVKSFFGRTAQQDGQFTVELTQAVCPE